MAGTWHGPRRKLHVQARAANITVPLESKHSHQTHGADACCTLNVLGNASAGCNGAGHTLTTFLQFANSPVTISISPAASPRDLGRTPLSMALGPDARPQPLAGRAAAGEADTQNQWQAVRPVPLFVSKLPPHLVQNDQVPSGAETRDEPKDAGTCASSWSPSQQRHHQLCSPMLLRAQLSSESNDAEPGPASEAVAVMLLGGTGGGGGGVGGGGRGGGGGGQRRRVEGSRHHRRGAGATWSLSQPFRSSLTAIPESPTGSPPAIG
jgi:hypothetical protein